MNYKGNAANAPNSAVGRGMTLARDRCSAARPYGRNQIECYSEKVAGATDEESRPAPAPCKRSERGSSLRSLENRPGLVIPARPIARRAGSSGNPLIDTIRTPPSRGATGPEIFITMGGPQAHVIPSLTWAAGPCQTRNDRSRKPSNETGACDRAMQGTNRDMCI